MLLINPFFGIWFVLYLSYPYKEAECHIMGVAKIAFTLTN